MENEYPEIFFTEKALNICQKRTNERREKNRNKERWYDGWWHKI